MLSRLLNNRERSRWIQMIAVIAIQIHLVLLWGQTGIIKFIDPGYAVGFAEQFKDTFLAAMPGGVLLQMRLVGALEMTASLLALGSLIRIEFWSGRFVFLKLSLALSLLNFAVIGFGLRLVRDFNLSAQSFFYSGAIAAFYLLIQGFESGAKASANSGRIRTSP